MPSMALQSLSGQSIDIKEASKGHITLVTFALRDGSMKLTHSWLELLSKQFPDTPQIKHYQCTLVEGKMYQRFLKSIILSSLRKQVPASSHDFFLTGFEDFKAERDALGMGNPFAAYVYLLDHNGLVRWRGCGEAKEEDEAALVDSIKLLLREMGGAAQQTQEEGEGEGEAL